MTKSNPSKKVLIVEDNPLMSKLLAEMLEVFDIESLRAIDGESALQMLLEQPFSLMITDLRMPKMNGVELLKTVKEKYPQLPVVVVTGFATEPAENDILAASADGFLHKPFRMDDIARILQRLVKA